LAGAATALANHHFHHDPAQMRARISAHIDEALAAAPSVTAQQRAAVYAARDRVFAAFAESHKDRRADLERALKLFEADKLDDAAVQALRAEHEAEMKRVGEAIHQAIVDVHGVLDGAQRKAIVAFVRDHKPSGAPMKMRGAFMKTMVERRIDDALDAAKATPEQRQAIAAARDHVFATFEETHGEHDVDLERALSLLEADKLDEAKLAALRSEHQAKAKKIGDSIVQAIYDAHDALTPPQRRAVADFVRAHHDAHEAHGG
jgi:Spy/CpxP family protein refolding chaperone